METNLLKQHKQMPIVPNILLLLENTVMFPTFNLLVRKKSELK